MISQTVEEFWECYRGLPQSVRQTAQRAYAIWQQNHYHPSLHFKPLKDTTPTLYSVRVGLGYRALGYAEQEDEQTTITWFWMGSHAEYDKIIQSL